MSYIDEYITKYVKKYKLKIKHSYTDDCDKLSGNLYLYIKENDIKIGHLHYSVDYDEKDLHIDKVFVSEKKPDFDIKKIKGVSMKLMLIYLFSLFTDNIKTVTLTAVPSFDKTKKGQEFCLMCFYEKHLGFKEVPRKGLVDGVGYGGYKQEELETCKRKIFTIESIDSCILCECQKEKVDFTKRDLSYLQVDMKVLLRNLKKYLDVVYNKIKHKD